MYLFSEVRSQDFDGRLGRRHANPLNASHELGGAPIGEIISVHRCNHHMSQIQSGHGRSEPGGLVVIHRIRAPGRHITKRAGPSADTAQDHHRGVTLRPALRQVRTRGFFADCIEALLADERASLLDNIAISQANTKPVRFFVRMIPCSLLSQKREQTVLDSVAHSNVDRPVVRRQHRLMHGFRQGRMSKNRLHQFGFGRLKIHGTTNP